MKSNNKYQHTQVGYLMLAATFIVFVFFAWLQMTARAETPSADSGTNFAITVIMVLILFILASFSTLTVMIDEQFLKVRFGWGVFHKSFHLPRLQQLRK